MRRWEGVLWRKLCGSLEKWSAKTYRASSSALYVPKDFRHVQRSMETFYQYTNTSIHFCDRLNGGQ